MASDSTPSSLKHATNVAEPTDDVGHVLDDMRRDDVVEGNVGTDRVVDRSVCHVVDRHDGIDIEADVCRVASAQLVGVDVIDVTDVAHLAAHDRIDERAELETLRRGDIDGRQAASRSGQASARCYPWTVAGS